MRSFSLLLVASTLVSANEGHTVIDNCTCFEKGNYYSPVSADGCASFTQRTAFLPAMTQNCPSGLQFDVQECYCNWPGFTVCPSNCQLANEPTDPPQRTCTRNGNIYAQVPDINCYQFTQATDVLRPQIHSCPPGLQFDLSTCVCNYPSVTDCYA